MPTYDYACAKCGLMEIQHSIKAAAVTTCPTCGGTKFHRSVSRPQSPVFRGTGFWETDYNRSNEYKEKSKP